MPAPSLIDRQLWLLGRDALHPDGNLLVAAGLSREAPPDGRAETARYRSSATTPELVLWSFGLAFGPCVWLRTGEPVRWPRSQPPDLWTPSEAKAQLATAGPAHVRDVLRVVTWMAVWERYVESAHGLAHREARDDRACLLADGPAALHREWERYTDELLAGAQGPQRAQRSERMTSAFRSTPSPTSCR